MKKKEEIKTETKPEGHCMWRENVLVIHNCIDQLSRLSTREAAYVIEYLGLYFRKENNMRADRCSGGSYSDV